MPGWPRGCKTAAGPGERARRAFCKPTQRQPGLPSLSKAEMTARCHPSPRPSSSVRSGRVLGADSPGIASEWDLLGPRHAAPGRAGLGASGRCSPGSRGTEWSGARPTLRAGALLTAWGTSGRGAASPSSTRSERRKRLRARWCRGTASGCWWRLHEGTARPGGTAGGTQLGEGQRRVTQPHIHGIVWDIRDQPVPSPGCGRCPMSLPRREFPSHAHHQVSFHGNKSKKAFCLFFFCR